MIHVVPYLSWILGWAFLRCVVQTMGLTGEIPAHSEEAPVKASQPLKDTAKAATSKSVRMVRDGDKIADIVGQILLIKSPAGLGKKAYDALCLRSMCLKSCLTVIRRRPI